jgi:hypothetical protein
MKPETIGILGGILGAAIGVVGGVGDRHMESKTGEDSERRVWRARVTSRRREDAIRR